MRFEATTLDTVGVEVVLVDDGGVISDNERRAPEWQRLIGEYLSPRLGGAQEKWALANRTVVTPLWDEMFSEPLDGRPYLELYESYLVLWLARMCEAADVAMPPHNEALALAWETTRFVTTNVRAAFPGVADAVNALSAPGLVLHTASAGASWELEGYFKWCRYPGAVSAPLRGRPGRGAQVGRKALLREHVPSARSRPQLRLGRR